MTGAHVGYLDAEPNGIAAMLGGLIQANLTAHPERARHAWKPATFSILAPDADVGASIRLSNGTVSVRNGLVSRADVRIRADSETLVGLSAVPLRFGLPDLATKEGRRVVGKILRRELRIGGLLLRPGKLARLSRLLAVR